VLGFMTLSGRAASFLILLRHAFSHKKWPGNPCTAVVFCASRPVCARGTTYGERGPFGTFTKGNLLIVVQRQPYRGREDCGRLAASYRNKRRGDRFADPVFSPPAIFFGPHLTDVPQHAEVWSGRAFVPTGARPRCACAPFVAGETPMRIRHVLASLAVTALLTALNGCCCSKCHRECAPPPLATPGPCCPPTPTIPAPPPGQPIPPPPPG
jgi:hypothetical protein